MDETLDKMETPKIVRDYEAKEQKYKNAYFLIVLLEVVVTILSFLDGTIGDVTKYLSFIIPSTSLVISFVLVKK